MGATAVGLWLVGVGSFATVVTVALDPPSRGSGGLRYGSPESARPERIRHAAQAIALAFVAVGSVIVAVAGLPTAWFGAVSPATFFAGVWLICAWSQHRVWAPQPEQYETAAATPEDARCPMMKWEAECVRHCARWSWALRHPFNGETWPRDFRRRHPQPEG